MRRAGYETEGRAVAPPSGTSLRPATSSLSFSFPVGRLLFCVLCFRHCVCHRGLHSSIYRCMFHSFFILKNVLFQ